MNLNKIIIITPGCPWLKVFINVGLIVVPMHFSGFFHAKQTIIRWIWTCQNFGCHFLGQSLLLSTTILNDYYFLVIIIVSAKASYDMWWKFYFMPITNLWSRLIVHFISEFFHVIITLIRMTSEIGIHTLFLLILYCNRISKL